MESGFSHYSPRWPLTSYIVGFWAYGHYAQNHKQERLLPTGTMNLVFTVDGTEPGSTTVSGSHSKYILLDTTKPFSAIAASFRPGGGFPFFGVPANALGNLNVPLESLLRQEARDLRDRLMSALTALEAFRELETFLLNRLKEHTGRAAGVRYALKTFHFASRPPRISEVAEDIGWTAKKFITTFSKEVGLTPKAYSRVVRFRRAIDLVDGGRDIDWTQVALSCGYFDQAHFIHDFRGFCGVTPTEFLRKRVSTNHVRIG